MVGSRVPGAPKQLESTCLPRCRLEKATIHVNVEDRVRRYRQSPVTHANHEDSLPDILYQIRRHQ